MKSPAYNEAMDYALEVLKAIKESGYEQDFPLEQFLNASMRIGACLAMCETSVDHEEMSEAYDEANINANRSIYWAEILGRIEDYEKIPFDSLRKKCENLQVKIHDECK